jgi:hypothetical protein
MKKKEAPKGPLAEKLQAIFNTNRVLKMAQSLFGKRNSCN